MICWLVALVTEKKTEWKDSSATNISFLKESRI